MGRPTFTGYEAGIKEKTGNDLDYFWKLAVKNKLVKKGGLTKRHSEVVSWLKKNAGVGHVHASFLVLYLKLRSGDPSVTAHMKKFAKNRLQEANR